MVVHVWFGLCDFSSQRVRLDMKVVVVVSRFSWGLTCMWHVNMTLWVCLLREAGVQKNELNLKCVLTVELQAAKLGFSNTILSHRGTLMHFNKLWSEDDDSHWKMEPSCWVISSALEKHRNIWVTDEICYCNWIQTSGWLSGTTLHRLCLCNVDSLWHILMLK